MKPVVSASTAWMCFIAFMYQIGHEEFTGGINDPSPEQGKRLAKSVGGAAFLYAILFFVCLCQGFHNKRASGRGSIAL
ncbi:hypothetical protein GMORB2_5639 [Geosmithia morbida]|uniref:Uncharacterized protein n=1 Tax=Geosmithia morbida TaxID=1094350 RepID=A0A9P4YVK9_9HYPO|nr:uncharacterized protein GMORB2_5639 [Geosmithia morbida]KAF4123923.1 hypothetical protein GMORB2_5639 [Geosmithia morbida]